MHTHWSCGSIKATLGGHTLPLAFIVGVRLLLFVADRSLLAAKRFGTRESRNVFVAFGDAGVMLAAAFFE
jgi:hypothetical protein